MDVQLEKENISMPIKQRLNEAVFAGNALLTINQTTPYNAVFGRVPHLLPDVNQFNDPKGELGSGPVPGLVADSQRLREIAVQKMVEGSAITRINNALRSKTQPPAQMLDLSPGDLVDFYRQPSSKDVPGWLGPAKVVNILDAARGHIDVKFQGRVWSVKHPHCRRHAVFMCSMLATQTEAQQGAEDIVMRAIGSMPPNSTSTLGKLFINGQWRYSRETQPCSQSYEALKWLAETKYQLSPCETFRIFKGCSVLKAMPFHQRCVLIWWRPDSPTLINSYEYSPSVNLNLRQLFPTDWSLIQGVLFYFNDSADEDDDAVVDHPDDPAEIPVIDESRIETETSDATEYHDADSFSSAVSNFFVHDQMNPELLSACQEATAAVYADTDKYVAESSDEESEPSIANSEPAQPDVIPMYHYFSANAAAGLPRNTALPGRAEYIDIEYPGETSKLLSLPRQPGPGEVAILRTYLAAGARKAVIERDTDLLTAEELEKHKAEVEAAVLAELTTWANFKCFSPKKRRTATNIIDSRFVYKWKYETVDGVPRRIIRARLCVRGFKDRDKQFLDTYAGTSKRYSQRIVASTAAMRGWPIATADISKAFLQGVTYEELAALTGEPLREVNFTLPNGAVDAVACLRKVPGFESFNPREHVLHNDKPGTGSVDAPRAFSIKLSQVTQSLDLQPTTTDEELVLKHNRQTGELEAVMSKHVDDLKITGSRETILEITSKLEKVFGKIKLEWHTFTNCGVRHIQDPKTMEVTLDQEEYIAALKPISTEGIKSKDPTSKLDTATEGLFRFLLGAAAFALLTRVDVAVFMAPCETVKHGSAVHAKEPPPNCVCPIKT
jgi:hypothetical protein